MSHGGCLHCDNMISSTTYTRQRNLTTILQSNTLDSASSGVQCTTCHHTAHHTISVGLTLDKDTTTNEFPTIGKSDFPRRDDMLACLAIPKLAKFGCTGSIQVAGGGEEGRDVFSTGCLNNGRGGMHNKLVHRWQVFE